MKHISCRCPLLLFFILVPLFLSACADDTIYTDAELVPPPEKVEAVVLEEEVEEPDPELKEFEPGFCLDEELTALSQTGTWKLDTSPMQLKLNNQLNYSFPIVYNKQVEMYLKLFQGRQRKQFSRWLARSTMYKDMMEKELIKAGLPTDLVYLSMIESGFMPLAKSRSRAVGLWQFMKGTARQYHLRIDRYVDERRDPEKSTKAAVSFFE